MSKPKSGMFNGTAGSKIVKASNESEKKNPSNSKGDANKKNHIFHKERHKLQNFLKTFNNDEDAALNKLQEVYNNHIKSSGIKNGRVTVIVNINGFDITISGVAIDGVGHIGTAYEGEQIK